jgi:hypothetical protein
MFVVCCYFRSNSSLSDTQDDDLPLDCTTPDCTPREIRRIANALLTWPSCGILGICDWGFFLGFRFISIYCFVVLFLRVTVPHF